MTSDCSVQLDWAVVQQAGRKRNDLSHALRALLWQGQPNIPIEILVSDNAQYFWAMDCGMHVTVQTIQATRDNFVRHSCTAVCRRCKVGYRNGVEPCGDRLASTYAQRAWLGVEMALELDTVVRKISQHAAYACFSGKNAGYAIDVKVLRSRFGAADIYVPALDLVIQVDGEHHDTTHQQSVDMRFNVECMKQGRNLLRLHHRDDMHYKKYINRAMQMCGNGKLVLMFSCSHPLKAPSLEYLDCVTTDSDSM
jgi:hypothetical protein